MTYFDNYRFGSFEQFSNLTKLVQYHARLPQPPHWDQEALNDLLVELAQADEVGEFARLLLRRKWDKIPAERKMAFLAMISEEEVVTILANNLDR